MAECMELSGQMIMPEPFDLDCGLPKQVKEETFTENGSYEIMPDEGFQLDKAKVNVEVSMPEKQAKVLEVQKNGYYEVLPDELKVLSKVSVNVATPEQKPETTFGIGYDKNGKYLIRPQEGYVFSEGMVDINVPSQIDLTQIGFTEVQNQQYNEPFLNGIEYAKAIQKDWVDKEDLSNRFAYDKSLKYLPKLPMTKAKKMDNMCAFCDNLEAVAYINLENATSIEQLFYNSFALKLIPNLDTKNVKIFRGAFKSTSIPSLSINTDNATDLGFLCWSANKLKSLILTSVENVTNFDRMILSTRCEELRMDKWKQANLNFQFNNELSIDSIKYIIDKAFVAPESPRTLTLSSNVGKLFEQEPDFADYQQRASEKGITIQW